METDYKKWLQNQEAKKKAEQDLEDAKELYLTEEEEQLKNSVLMENIQERQSSSRIERQTDQEDRNYDRKQKITRLKNDISEKSQEQPQTAKAGKFMRQKVGNFASNNPKLTQAYNTFKDRRSQEIERIKQAAKREAETQIKRRAAQVTQRVGQAATRVAAQAARALAVAAGEAIGSIAVAAGASIGVTGAIVMLVILVVIVVIAQVYQACNDNVLYSTICEGVTLIGKGVNWIMGW